MLSAQVRQHDFTEDRKSARSNNFPCFHFLKAYFLYKDYRWSCFLVEYSPVKQASHEKETSHENISELINLEENIFIYLYFQFISQSTVHAKKASVKIICYKFV